MDLQEAKTVFEELGIVDELTPAMIEASGVLLDRLTELETAPKPQRQYDWYVHGCGCDLCQSIHTNFPEAMAFRPLSTPTSQVQPDSLGEQGAYDPNWLSAADLMDDEDDEEGW